MFGNLIDRLVERWKGPTLEETLVGEEGLLLDAEINGRRHTYVHERDPERAVLTVYKPGNRDAIEKVYYNTHFPPSKKRQKTDARRQASQGGVGWTMVVEQVDVHHDDGTELFASPKGGTFEYVDRKGNVYRASAHDDVAKAVVAQAREKYAELLRLYNTEYLPNIMQEARKIVSK